MKVSRRSFVGTVGSGIAALTSLGTAVAEAPGAPGLVYRHDDWKFADFDKLLKFKGRGKQMYDVHPINEGGFLSIIKNSINGLTFGFGIPVDEIKIVAAMHGPSNMLNFDDSMWAKYKLGEWLKVKDPDTGQPAVKNIFYPKKYTAGSTDPNDRKGIYQDWGIEALQPRGLQLLSCHNATEAQVNALIKQNSLKEPVEEIVADLQSHTLPGVIIVPTMVSAISMLQSEGHYSYIIAP
jgi:hypothetical protein